MVEFDRLEREKKEKEERGEEPGEPAKETLPSKQDDHAEPQ